MSSWTPRANKVCYPYITCHRWFQNLWYIFFYVYITIDNIFCIIIFEIFSHLHFCSNYFSSIMRHSSLKQYVLLKQILKFGYQFLPCNRYRINLLVKKKLIKFWPILGMQLTKSRLVLAAVVFNLTMKWPPMSPTSSWHVSFWCPLSTPNLATIQAITYIARPRKAHVCY